MHDRAKSEPRDRIGAICLKRGVLCGEQRAHRTCPEKLSETTAQKRTSIPVHVSFIPLMSYTYLRIWFCVPVGLTNICVTSPTVYNVLQRIKQLQLLRRTKPHYDVQENEEEEDNEDEEEDEDEEQEEEEEEQARREGGRRGWMRRKQKHMNCKESR